MAGRTRTEEVGTMSENSAGTTRGYKTIGVRIADPVHAQMTLIANLNGLSLTEAIQQAIDGYIEAQRSEGTFAQRASSALEDIEREAAARRQAIEALFGQNPTTADGPTPEGEAAKATKPTSRRNREQGS
jgi:hypothetical protein